MDRVEAFRSVDAIVQQLGLVVTGRAPPPEDGWVDDPDADWDSQPISSEQSGDLTFVEMEEFLATF